MIELPNQKEKKVTSFTRFSEMLNNLSFDDIKNNEFTSIYIDHPVIFDRYPEVFDMILKSGNYESFTARDISILKKIEDMLDPGTNVELALMDDFKNKDRSYIDINYFKKSKFYIPLSYLLWNINSISDPYVAYYYFASNLHRMNIKGHETISLDYLKYLLDIIKSMSSKMVGYSDLDKIIYISNYIQNNVQFVDEGNFTEGSLGKFVMDTNGVEIGREVHYLENVIDSHYGVCEGIANATTLLLNNPILNVNVRSVFGDSHVWNVVNLNGKNYYLDNTWAITRNNDKYPESLKAKSFDSSYILFGNDRASSVGNHNPYTYIDGSISNEDYSKEQINESVMKLSRTIKFDNYNEPVFKSRLEK